MSTQQTDAHNTQQESMYQGYCVLVDTFPYEEAKKALDQMIEVVDPKTHAKCKEYLQAKVIDTEWDGVPMDETVMVQRGEELQEQKEERESERMDEHFAPSEGPAV